MFGVLATPLATRTPNKHFPDLNVTSARRAVPSFNTYRPAVCLKKNIFVRATPFWTDITQFVTKSLSQLAPTRLIAGLENYWGTPQKAPGRSGELWGELRGEHRGELRGAPGRALGSPGRASGRVPGNSGKSSGELFREPQRSNGVRQGTNLVCDPRECPGPPGPKSQKSLKKSLFGGQQQSPRKYPKKSKNTRNAFSGIFGDLFADPQKDSF